MTARDKTPRQASCHCRAVRLEFYLKDGLSGARRCDCSFCMRRGAVAGTVAMGDLRVTKGADNLSLYSFNTHTAQHFFCKTCGVYTHHKRRSNPNEYGVNLANIDGLNIRDLGEIAWVDGVNHPSDV